MRIDIILAELAHFNISIEDIADELGLNLEDITLPILNEYRDKVSNSILDKRFDGHYFCRGKVSSFPYPKHLDWKYIRTFDLRTINYSYSSNICPKCNLQQSTTQH